MKNIRFLQIEEVIGIHYDQVQEHSGSLGIRDRNLLESALHAPQATFAGVYLHATIYEMAAAFGHGIIKNHPFVDGNKRTGMMSMLMFLSYNQITVELSQSEFFNLAISIATSQLSIEEIAHILKKHSKK